MRGCTRAVMFTGALLFPAVQMTLLRMMISSALAPVGLTLLNLFSATRILQIAVSRTATSYHLMCSQIAHQMHQTLQPHIHNGRITQGWGRAALHSCSHCFLGKVTEPKTELVANTRSEAQIMMWAATLSVHCSLSLNSTI